MAIRDILIIPDKRLRLKSEPVKAADKALRALVDDMFATMYAAPGIGLAAIQIGVAKRVVTMDLAKKDDPPEPQVFINPEVTWSSRSEELCTTRRASAWRRSRSAWPSASSPWTSPRRMTRRSRRSSSIRKSLGHPDRKSYVRRAGHRPGGDPDRRGQARRHHGPRQEG